MSLAMPLSNTLRLPARAARPSRTNSSVLSENPEGAFESFCMSSTDILQGQKAVEIKHNGLTYRLQATRLGKLILTK